LAKKDQKSIFDASGEPEKKTQDFHMLAMFLLDHFLYENKKGLVTC
jgi:hypothetical protein